MTWKQLKESLGIPDDAIVVVKTSDHGYRAAGVEQTKALAYYEGRTIHLSEDDGVDEPGQNSQPTKVPVLVFS